MSASPRSPRSPGLPRERALLYDPGGIYPSALASRSMLPSAFPDSVGFHALLYGAQSHGPPTRCLRFAFGSPLRRKTRFWLCLRPWPGGVGYPRGIIPRFQFILHPPWLKVTGAPGRREGKGTILKISSRLPVQIPAVFQAFHPLNADGEGGWGMRVGLTSPVSRIAAFAGEHPRWGL